MRFWKRKPSGCGPRAECCRRAVAGLLGLCLASPLLAQDDYLKALESESGKVDSADDASSRTRSGAGTGSSSARAAGSSGVTQEQFESLLQDKYRGTYVFYRQLQPHTQEEIYSEFSSGVPIAELRDKIVDRYLQR